MSVGTPDAARCACNSSRRSLLRADTRHVGAGLPSPKAILANQPGNPLTGTAMDSWINPASSALSPASDQPEEPHFRGCGPSIPDTLTR